MIRQPLTSNRLCRNANRAKLETRHVPFWHHLLMFALASACHAEAAAAERQPVMCAKPNVLLMVADDLGYGDPDYNGELKPGPLEIGFDSFFGTPRTHSEPPLVFVEGHRAAGLRDETAAHMRSYWGEMTDKGADTFWAVYVSGDDKLSPYKKPPHEQLLPRLELYADVSAAENMRERPSFMF